MAQESHVSQVLQQPVPSLPGTVVHHACKQIPWHLTRLKYRVFMAHKSWAACASFADAGIQTCFRTLYLKVGVGIQLHEKCDNSCSAWRSCSSYPLAMSRVCYQYA